MQASPVIETVRIFFRDFFPHAPESVCCAVSGGADSMAMLRVFLCLKEELGITRLGVAHVNHNLRGEESDMDALFVKNAANKAGISYHELHLLPREKKSGIEAWARQERYGFFKDLIVSKQYTCVATGHTADDQAETVLMRLMRGCGLKGLCGIEPIRRDGIIRPLLYVSRSELHAFLASRGGDFREDSSNKKLDFTRNRIRNIELPALEAAHPGSREVLSHISRSARQVWENFEPHINKWIANYVVEKNEQEFSIKKSAFSECFFTEEAVAHTLREKGIDFLQCHIDDVVRSVEKTNITTLLCGEWRCKSSREYLRFFKGSDNASRENLHEYGIEIHVPGVTDVSACSLSFKAEYVDGSIPQKALISPDNLSVFLDADRVGSSLECRTVRPDDTFQPLGCPEKRNIREYIKKRKKDWNLACIVAQKDGEIIWIPGIQIAHGFRVIPQSRAILKISAINAQ